MESGVLLVKDLPAEKRESTFGGLRTSNKPVNALKGELLIAIPGDRLVPRNDGGKPHNYRLARDTTVSLRAEDTDVSPHSPREFSLLEAVKEPHTRYSIFLSIGKLDWASSLRVGSEVYVLVNPEKHQSAWVYSKAVVRWFGELGDQRGTFFGVEITEKGYCGQGLTDGTFQGKRYFHCQDNCGFFVALDKLSRHRDGHDLAAVPPSETRYSGHSHDQSRGQDHQSHQSQLNQQSGPVTRSKTSASKKETPNPSAEGPRFKVKDRVVAYNNKGRAVHGTVQWVGKHSSKEFKSAYICGLEMDVPFKKGEFPDALPDTAHLIRGANNKKLFLFEPFIRFEEEAALAKMPQKFESASTTTSVDPEVVAQQLGTSAQELLEDELEALKQAHERKQKEGLPDDVNIQEQVEAMRQLEKENKEKMRAKVQPNPEEILRAKPTPHPKGARPSSAEVSGVPTGRSKFVHSVSDASYDRGNSAQAQQPTQYDDNKLHLAATSHSNDPNRPPTVRQHSYQERYYESIDELTGPGLQEHGPSDVPTHQDGHQQPLQHNLHYNQHAAGLQGQHPSGHQDLQLPPQYQGHGGQPVPQHHNGSGQAGHFQQSASSPHQSPRLEAQYEHGKPPHQQPQSSQLTPGSHLQPSDSNVPPAIAPSPGESDPSLSLGIGSMVQVSDPPHYGVLRWIGNLSEIPGTIAGVELEEGMNGCTDGSRNGVKYFDCKPGRGLFCPLSSLKPDERFTVPGETPGAAVVQNPLHKWPLQESLDQPFVDINVEKYLGEERGIQGHQNSCYLDATVFGLFAVSDVFDSMFLKRASDPAVKEIGDILWKRIVNPLRMNGVVRYESVMAMRNKLEEIGKMKGVNQDEKDPEEFLNMLFKHVLHVEPFITIRRPFGVEQEYFVQLFLEFDETVKIPTVGFLLTKMFKEQNISFTEAPSKLLIQVPRFGKKFKTYDKIVPDLQLDIGKLLPSPYPCFICADSAWNKCTLCTEDFKTQDDFVYFCDTCCSKAHCKETNRDHHQIEEATATSSYLQLLSVICIETSHYVCFAHTEGRWIFLDSMANRVYDMYNIPKGVDCTQDLNEWVYTQDWSRLSSTPPRELPEYVRRFTQDIYMCVYINPDAAMYL